MTELSPLIVVKNLIFNVEQQCLIDQVSLTLMPREIVTLIGPNGAGKSTLLKLILGLLTPSAGTILIKNNTKIGYMPQSLNLNPYIPMTVCGFLQLNAKLNSTQLQDLLNDLSIFHLIKNSIHALSGGELQRVLLARALTGKPQILILDEPAQGVDLMGQDELYRLIKKIRDSSQCGILMVSHDLHLVMAETDSVICLNKHICCSGSPDLVSQHQDFKSLFDLNKSQAIGVYAHQHSHRHAVDGSICT